MLNQLLTCLLFSMLTGTAAGVYVSILTQPGHILAFWAEWLYRVKDWYVGVSANRQREERADYWLKPILTCGYCVGGQFGLWGLLCYTIDLPFLLYLLTACCSCFIGGQLATYLQPK